MGSRLATIKDVLDMMPKTFYQNDNVGRTFGTSYVDGFISDIFTIRAAFNCRYHYELPSRNNSTSWGGGYTQLHISIDGGSYQYVGNTGYQNAMGISAAIIRTDIKTVILKRGDYGIPVTGDYSIRVKLRHRSFDGSLKINSSRGTSDAIFSSYHEFKEVNI